MTRRLIARCLPFLLLLIAALSCHLPPVVQPTPDEAALQTQYLEHALTAVVASYTAAALETRPASATPQPTLTATATVTPTETPTPTITPTLSPTPDPWVDAALAQMSLEQKIGQMLMIGVEGRMTATACSALSRFAPGAVVYLGANIASPDQLRTLSAGLQDCAARGGMPPLWIAVDHEGQYVNRFGVTATIFPMAMAIGATGDPANAYRAAFAGGQELAYSGVNLVLGPDADVLLNYDNSVISLRAYGGDPARVGLFVAEAVRGYLAAGVAPVLKHFPGHGGVAGDSHDVLPVDAADLDALRQSYLPPFQSGIAAGAPAVMFSHVAFPALDGGVTRPAGLSPVLVDLLHSELGFQGFTLTDSMVMGAITRGYGGVGAAGLQVILAGVDMLLTPTFESSQAAYNALLSAARSGQLPLERIDQAVRRILSAKAQWGLSRLPVPRGDPPDWAVNREIAYDIGYRSVAKLRDQAALIPLSPAAPRLLVVGPTDGWGLYPALQGALVAAGFAPALFTFSGPWNGAVPERNYLYSLPAQAANYDLVLVFTWEAHLNRLRYGDTFQAELVNNLLATGMPVVVVALKSPTDLLEFPQAQTFLATYGTTAGQVQGIVDVLVGKAAPGGVNPLPGLIVP